MPRPEYYSWQAMRTRCNNPTRSCYKYYGGRGVSVCPEWASFETFLADMGDRPAGTTLDRIDTNGNYCKDNCRWVSKTEQRLNQDRVAKYEYRGETLSMSQLSKKYSVSFWLIRRRLESGWDVVKAMEKPSQKKRHSDCKNT